MKAKKKILVILFLVLGLLVCQAGVSEAAPMGTAFTYQGRLIDANQPADGPYDLQFALFTDPNLSGSQIGPTVEVNDIDIIDGYFTVELDFGDKVFNGDARWLEIGIRPWDSKERYSLLGPRQEVTPTPYALYAQNARSDNDWMVIGNDMYSIPSGKIGIGTTSPTSSLEVISPLNTHAIRATTDYIPVYALRTSTTGTWPAVAGDCNSEASSASGVRGRILSTSPGTLGAGVYGYNYGTGSNGVGVRGTHDGSGIGVYGQASGSSGRGVYGEATNTSDIANYGGYFVSKGGRGKGVYGEASDTGNFQNEGGRFAAQGRYGRGVYGVATGSDGRGVYGLATHSSGTNYGVYGQTYSSAGYAGYFDGNVYVTLNVSALSFTDRTPYPKDLATAYEAIMSMDRLPDGEYDQYNKELQLDHSKLADFVRSEKGNRDLSATVSCHNEVLKDLTRKQQELGKAYIYIEQLHRRIEVLEDENEKIKTSLASIESMLANLSH